MDWEQLQIYFIHLINLAKHNSIDGIVEKPELGNATSNIVSIIHYFLRPDILRNKSVGSGGEIQLLDAINIQAKFGNAEAIEFKGECFDCGRLDGYLSKIHYVAKKIVFENTC